MNELPDDARNRCGLIRDARQVHADGHFTVELRERLIEAFPKPDNVATLGHGNSDTDRRLPIEAHLCRGRILITAIDGGNVAEAEAAPLPVQRHSAQLRDGVEVAGHAQVDSVGCGIEGTGRNHGVLRRQCLSNQLRRDAELIAFGVGNIDVDALFLHAQQLDLGYIGNPQQSLANAIAVVFQLLIGEIGAGKRIDIPEGVAEFIVERRSDNSGRQSISHITNFFSHLVETIEYRRRWQILAKHHEYLGFARSRIGAQIVQTIQLLQFFLDTVGHQTIYFIGRRTGPLGAHHHHSKGERRIFRLAQMKIAVDAECAEQQRDVAHENAIGQRPLAQIEALHPRSRAGARVSIHSRNVVTRAPAGIQPWRFDRRSICRRSICRQQWDAHRRGQGVDSFIGRITRARLWRCDQPG